MTSVAQDMPGAATPDDRALLRAYAEGGSAAAFAALVERHIPVVYAAAMRQYRNDSHRAQDVAQIVFMALSQKAARLGPDVLLSGWLVRATHFTARSVHRAETRRRRREAKAAASREREAAMRARDEGRSEPNSSSDGAVLWERVAPLLDEAMAHLPAAARDVLVLRFLEGRAFAEVGKRLGMSEDAARKRAQRGLSSLRALLARRGIRTADDALAAALQWAAAAPVPAELARAVAAGVGAAHHHVAVLKGAMKLMAWTKAKTATVAAIAALLIGGGGAVVAHRLIRPPAGTHVIALANNGNAPAAAIQRVPAAYLPIARGIVRDAAGHPVAGARVMISFEKTQYVKLTPDPRTGPPTSPQTITAEDGSFSVTVPKPPFGAVVAAPEGVVEASAADLSAGATLTIRPYARMEGTIRFDHEPTTREKQVAVSTAQLPGHVAPFELWGTTDAGGHFVVEHVPPGQYSVYMLGMNVMGQIRFDPGTDARVELDLTRRRAVAGRIDGLPRQARVGVSFVSLPIRDIAREPAALFVMGFQRLNAAVDADGAFTSGPVMPGTYRLSIGGDAGRFVQRDVQIPPVLPGMPSTPVDVGTLTLKRSGS